MLYPTPFPGWAARLLTGDPDVDTEHRLLANAIARLRDACPDAENRVDCSTCSRARAADCNHNLVEALGDLLSFLVDHFFAEEQAMKKFGLVSREKELCDRHKEDHARISDTVLRIVGALDSPQTVKLIRELHAVLDTWLKHHIELHDAVLLEMIRQR
ncbi:MAG: bacteriohemerythrin [Actinomycetota bacterium]